MRLRRLAQVARLLADVEDGAVELSLVADPDEARQNRFQFMTTDGSARIFVAAPSGEWGVLMAVQLPDGVVISAAELHAMGFAEYHPPREDSRRTYGLPVGARP
jgi:hypothetical protein